MDSRYIVHCFFFSIRRTSEIDSWTIIQNFIILSIRGELILQRSLPSFLPKIPIQFMLQSWQNSFNYMRTNWNLSNPSSGLCQFHSFYVHRWQVVVEIDLFYEVHTILFKLPCNFRLPSFLKGLKEG